MTQIVQPNSEALELATQYLQKSLPIVLATDTVYGLAVKAGDTVALSRLFELKQRPVDRAIAVLVSDITMAESLVQLNAEAKFLAQRFWPGALTIVAPRQAGVSSDIGAHDRTVGVRVPNNDFVRKLCERIGPLAVSSANVSGKQTPTCLEEVLLCLGHKVPIAVEGSDMNEVASTVVRVSPQVNPRVSTEQNSVVEASDRDHQDLIVLREGVVAKSDIKALLGDVFG